MKVKFNQKTSYCLDGMQPTTFKKGDVADVTDLQGKMFIDRKLAKAYSAADEATAKKLQKASDKKAADLAEEKAKLAKEAEEKEAQRQADLEAEKTGEATDEERNEIEGEDVTGDGK